VKLPPALGYHDFRRFTMGYFPLRAVSTRAISFFLFDREFGSLVAVVLGSIGAIVPVPAAVAGSALLCGLVSWLLPTVTLSKPSL
jgi:hypothetical protein